MKLLLCVVLLALFCCVQADLTTARWDLAGAGINILQNNIWREIAAFGGGRTDKEIFDTVDVIYLGASSHVFTSTSLSQARYKLTAAAAGDVIVFAGGFTEAGASNVVDVFYFFAISTAPVRTSRQLSGRGGHVFGAGGGRTIAFAQHGELENETIVDVFDVKNRTWCAFTLPDECYRASSLNGTITLLCNKGIQSYITSSNSWLLHPFAEPLTRDTMAAYMQLTSEWFKREGEALQFGGLSLLSPPCEDPFAVTAADQCNATVAADSSSVFFVGGASMDAHGFTCQLGEMRQFEAGSKGEADPSLNSSTTHMPGLSALSVVAFSNDATSQIIMAGGYSLLDPTDCNSEKLASASVLYYDTSSTPSTLDCSLPAPPFPGVHCSDGMWTTLRPVFIPPNTSFSLNVSLAAPSLIVGVDATLILEPHATLEISERIQLDENSTVRISSYAQVRGTTATASASRSARIVIGLPHDQSPWPWTGDVGTARIIVKGYWEPQVGSNPIQLLYSRMRQCDASMEVELLATHASDSRYACRPKLEFKNCLWLTITLEEGCGVMWDSLTLLLIFAVALVCGLLALKMQIKPPPYSFPAPPLAEEETCSICLQPCESPVLIRCNHRFCDKCIDEWTLVRNTCPVCRGAVRTEIDVLLHSNRLYKGTISTTAMITLTAILWVASAYYFNRTIIIWSVFTSFGLLLVHAGLIIWACDQLEAAIRHTLRIHWFAVVWYSAALVPSIAIALLAYSALQYRYTGYMSVDSLERSLPRSSFQWLEDQGNPVGWYGLLWNGTFHDWQSVYLLDDRFRPLLHVGTLINILLYLSLLQIAICILNWTFAVPLQHLRISRSAVFFLLALFIISITFGIILSIAAWSLPFHLSLGFDIENTPYFFESGPIRLLCILLLYIFLASLAGTVLRRLFKSSEAHVEVEMQSLPADEGGVMMNEQRREDEQAPLADDQHKANEDDQLPMQRVQVRENNNDDAAKEAHGLIQDP